jgi:pyruvate dehydrogenase E1 component alpha subunit
MEVTTMVHTLTPAAELGVDIDDVARLLTADGERIADSALDPWIADVDAAQLQALYRDMVVLRRIDAEGVALQRQGQLGLWAPCTGQ